MSYILNDILSFLLMFGGSALFYAGFVIFTSLCVKNLLLHQPPFRQPHGLSEVLAFISILMMFSIFPIFIYLLLSTGSFISAFWNIVFSIVMLGLFFFAVGFVLFIVSVILLTVTIRQHRSSLDATVLCIASDLLMFPALLEICFLW